MAMLTPEQQEAFSDILVCGLMSVGQSLYESYVSVDDLISDRT